MCTRASDPRPQSPVLSPPVLLGVNPKRKNNLRRALNQFAQCLLKTRLLEPGGTCWPSPCP